MIKAFGCPIDSLQFASALRIKEKAELSEPLKPFRGALVILQRILNESDFSAIDLERCAVAIRESEYEGASEATKELIDKGASFRRMFKTSSENPGGDSE